MRTPIVLQDCIRVKNTFLTILGFTGMNTYIHLKQPTEAETSASLYLLGFDSFLFSSDSLVLGSLVYIASGWLAKTLHVFNWDLTPKTR